MTPEAVLSPTSPGHLDSIDLSLELENSLYLESSPPTSPLSSARPPSLDAGVLVSIVTQLRLSVAELTKERDDLFLMLEDERQKQAALRDHVLIVTENSASLEQQLFAAQEKHKEDEEAIAMLRAKVEESRRGLMRLQNESRRASQLSSDHSSKRMSLITPIPSPTNRTHRRFASHSESGFLLNDTIENRQLLSPPINEPSSPDAGILTLRRYSSITSSSSEHDQSAWIQEIERLKRQLSDTKNKLEETTHELSEATEAREASEQCAKALRNYIADNQVGENVGRTSTSGSLPPLPAFVVSKSEEPKSSAKWSFRLWNGANGTNSGGTSPTQTVSGQSSPLGSATGGMPVQTTSPPALTRKFGSFFAARTGSISSISSATGQSVPSQPPAQIPSVYGSDASSSTEEEEPMSPLASSPSHVIVRDSTCSSDLTGDLEDKEKGKASIDKGTLSYQLTSKSVSET